MGFAFCRFVCGISDRQLGTGDFHDGQWEWPVGLAHYVERHAVLLPAAFVETMRSNLWKVPEHVDFSKPKMLKSIGYWRSVDEPTLPDPRTLVRPDWYGNDLPQILAYLRRGRDRMDDIQRAVPEWDLQHITESDRSFWFAWAKRHALPQQRGKFSVRQSLVRPTTFAEFWSQMEEWHLCPDQSYRARVERLVAETLFGGGELWHWQHGDPALSAGAAAGLAVLRGGELVGEWWLWLEEPWIYFDDGKPRNGDAPH